MAKTKKAPIKAPVRDAPSKAPPKPVKPVVVKKAKRVNKGHIATMREPTNKTTKPAISAGRNEPLDPSFGFSNRLTGLDKTIDRVVQNIGKKPEIDYSKIFL